MSKKNIFLLAAWYIAWGVISSLYSKKKSEDLKKELDKSDTKEGDFKVMFDNFIDTHQNLLEDLKSNVMTEKNKELLNEKKEELLEVIDLYKVKWEELIDELKFKWKDFIVEASDTLEKVYNEKKEEINQLKEVAPAKAKKIANDIRDAIDEAKQNSKK